jgi:glycerol uptake facilitator-like aquaporin
MSSKYVAEFLGTFIFVLLILFSIKWAKSVNASFLIPLCVGLGLIAGILICAGSGGDAHLNPAVSCTFFAKGDINIKQLAGYSLSQIFGSLFAFLIYKYTSELK